MLLKEIENETQSKEGWICPKCDAAVAPSEKECPSCKEQNLSEGILKDKQILNG